MKDSTIRYADTPELTGHLIVKIKELRVAIDKNIKETGRLRQVNNEDKAAREFSLTITKLEEARMWLGKALGELGQKLPEEFRDEG